MSPRAGSTMTTKTAKKIRQSAEATDRSDYLPSAYRDLDDAQTAIPALAKDPAATKQIEAAVHRVPTEHDLYLGDARNLSFLPERSVHLIVTSPPYWRLKEYRQSDGQLGHVQDYDEFLADLDRVWEHCFRALVPGGRLICVVGDVCLSRRKNKGRHTVVPLHASIQEHCRAIGFDNLKKVPGTPFRHSCPCWPLMPQTDRYLAVRSRLSLPVT